MAIKIQLRRGTEAEFDASHANAAITPVDGEVLIVQPSGTTGGYIVIGNGSDNWATLKADVDGRFYYMPGYSKTQMGGVQPAGNTPLTVTGASGQSVPIFVVEDNSGNDIFKVSDDESSNGAALVAIESHGQTADVVLSVCGQADQDDDNSGGDLLQVQPDVGHVGKGLTVDHSGNVSIVPVDDDGVTDTALRVTASGNSDNPIMRVQEADGTDLFKIAQGSSVFVKTLNLGNTPNHADPSNFGVVRSATTPNNTDSGADATHHLDDPHFRAKVSGSGTSMIGELELAGNSAVGASQKAITVVKNGTSANLAEIDYAGNIAVQGNITSEGKGTFADAEIDVTDRTTNAASVLRKDEIEAISLTKVTNFTFACTGAANIGGNDEVSRLVRLSGSDGDNARKLNVFDPDNVAANFTLVKASGTDTDPETASTNDVTNPYFVKIPANSGTMFVQLNLVGFRGDITYRILSYTSADGTTGKATLFDEDLNGGSTPSLVTRTVAIPNSSVDLFIAVNHDLRSNSGTDTSIVTSTGLLGGDTPPLLTFFRGDSGKNFTVGSESSLP